MGILRHPATLVVLVLLVILLFGSRRLPDLARSVGQSMKIFRSEVKDLRTDGAAPVKDPEGPAAGTPGADQPGPAQREARPEGTTPPTA